VKTYYVRWSRLVEPERRYAPFRTYRVMARSCKAAGEKVRKHEQPLAYDVLAASTTGPDKDEVVIDLEDPNAPV
jgi:hypothetical protein